MDFKLVFDSLHVRSRNDTYLLVAMWIVDANTPCQV